MSVGVAVMLLEIVAMFPDVLLTMAPCPVGTFPRLQFPAVFQSVLVPPVQELSWALAAERLMATMAVTSGTPMLELRRLVLWFLGFMVFSVRVPTVEK